MVWELIEVAGNLTPLPHSTVDVVAAKIESKVANTVIRYMNLLLFVVYSAGIFG
uniref:Uncharacterized protein n=1 Tax=Triticum urartu TaxID=4572 RepID=A0A8R7U803_TRIUA